MVMELPVRQPSAPSSSSLSPKLVSLERRVLAVCAKTHPNLSQMPLYKGNAENKHPPQH